MKPAAAEPAQLKSLVSQLREFLKLNDMRAYKTWEQASAVMESFITGEEDGVFKTSYRKFLIFQRPYLYLMTFYHVIPGQLIDEQKNP